jgi:hypothetical protein
MKSEKVAESCIMRSFVNVPEGKIILGRSRRRLMQNIKIDVMNIG